MSDDDPIQGLLTRWHAAQDRSALGQAFHLLRRQWAGPVCRYLSRQADDPVADQVLGDLLVDLLLPREGKPPKALAPEDHPSAARWRSRVLLNALKDQTRRQATYRSHVAAMAQAELPASSSDGPCERLAVQQMRRQVKRHLEQQEIRRRVALALALDIRVPMRWQRELSEALGEPAAEVRRRLDLAASCPTDEAARIRVLHRQDLPLARDAHRKLLRRAEEEIMGLIHKGQA